MKKFVIEPIGGLANRLRALFSAKILAEKYNYELKVNWIANEELNCAFHHLFLPIQNIEVFEDKILSQNIPSTIHSQGFMSKIQRNLLIKLKYGFDEVLKGTYPEEVSFVKTIETLLQKNKNIYVRCCESFVPNFEQQYPTYLKPVQKIVDTLHALEITENTYGLHIRRTDNKVSIEHSGLDKFITVIHTQLQHNSYAQFYLSTDSPAVENELKSLFNSKIMTYEKDFSRNTQKGI